MAVTLDLVLGRAVSEIISEANLRQRLAEGRPLRLKMGFDPSRPLLHIGHAVGIRKLRQFQELGHTVVLIVGDWTAQIGDPTGRDESRRMLTSEEVQQNAGTYMKQFFKLVDESRAEVRWQSEWFGNFTLHDVFRLAKQFTLADMMEHETFDKRFRGGLPLTMIELMYPALQAYDSIAVEADVEFGGTDQKFNILAGRQLMSRSGKRPQEVFLVPLLMAPDGSRQMSKSLGNRIDLLASPFDMYGKVMSMIDPLIPQYFRLVTDVPEPEIVEMEQELAGGGVNPRDLKMRLAREIVTEFHDKASAEAAEREFQQVFARRELPSEMPTFVLRQPMSLLELLLAAGLASSKSQGRRLIQQRGVKLEERVVEEAEEMVPLREGILSVGRRSFVRLVPDSS